MPGVWPKKKKKKKKKKNHNQLSLGFRIGNCFLPVQFYDFDTSLVSKVRKDSVLWLLSGIHLHFGNTSKCVPN